jgi:hypothetical protein
MACSGSLYPSVHLFGSFELICCFKIRSAVLSFIFTLLTVVLRGRVTAEMLRRSAGSLRLPASAVIISAVATD